MENYAKIVNRLKELCCCYGWIPESKGRISQPSNFDGQLPDIFASRFCLTFPGNCLILIIFCCVWDFEFVVLAVLQSARLASPHLTLSNFPNCWANGREIGRNGSLELFLLIENLIIFLLIITTHIASMVYSNLTAQIRDWAHVAAKMLLLLLFR